MIASHGAPDIIISGHDFSSFHCSQPSNTESSVPPSSLLTLQMHPAREGVVVIIHDTMNLICFTLWGLSLK